MGKPLMIQPEDEKRIENLKQRLGARTKVDVVRAGLQLLEKESDRLDRISRWKKVTAQAAERSAEVNLAFQKHSRLKRT